MNCLGEIIEAECVNGTTLTGKFVAFDGDFMKIEPAGGPAPPPADPQTARPTWTLLNSSQVLAIRPFSLSRVQAVVERVRAEEFIDRLEDASVSNIDGFLDAVEKKLLLNALEKSANVKTKAAELLGISFRSLRDRLAKYHLDDEA